MLRCCVHRLCLLIHYSFRSVKKPSVLVKQVNHYIYTSCYCIFAIDKYVRKFVYLKPKDVLDLFDKLIRPILNYSAEVWGFSQSMLIKRVQLQFCKQLFGVKQCTQNDFIFGESGCTSLLLDRHFKIIKYWLKICNANRNKYIWNIYNILLSDVDRYPNHINWVSLVRDLLSHLGFQYTCMVTTRCR